MDNSDADSGQQKSNDMNNNSVPEIPEIKEPSIEIPSFNSSDIEDPIADVLDNYEQPETNDVFDAEAAADNAPNPNEETEMSSDSEIAINLDSTQESSQESTPPSPEQTEQDSEEKIEIIIEPSTEEKDEMRSSDFASPVNATNTKSIVVNKKKAPLPARIVLVLGIVVSLMAIGMIAFFVIYFLVTGDNLLSF